MAKNLRRITAERLIMAALQRYELDLKFPDRSGIVEVVPCWQSKEALQNKFNGIHVLQAKAELVSLLVFQYFYSVRVFAGQDPASVWVGWVTPDYHYYSKNFNLSKVRTVTVTLGDERGRVHERSVHHLHGQNVGISESS